VRDSQASAPSEFDISSTEVEQALRTQEFDLSGSGEEGVVSLGDHHFNGPEHTDTRLLPEPSEWWTDQPDKPVSIRYDTSPATSEVPETVLQLFQRTVASHGDHYATGVKRQGEWRMATYQQYFEQCCTAAKAFIELGVDPFHGVCILGFNAPEWHISCLGSILACGVSVGLYLTSSAETCSIIASDCKAQVIVVENDSQLQKILEVRSKLPHLKAIVQYSKRLTDCKADGVSIFEWRHFLQLGRGVSEEVLKKRTDMLAPNKCCSIIYTSGTTGKPKGVMLSHDNLTWMCHRILEESTFNTGSEHIISYLPLSHIATQLVDVFTIMACAGTCWFAQPDAFKGSLLQTMKEIRPTIFFGVPRVWEKIAESLQLVASTQGKLKSRISSLAKNVGFRANYNKQLGSVSLYYS
jgi:long-chain-fatty-acid--CoA ligase ACSBG